MKIKNECVHCRKRKEAHHTLSNYCYESHGNTFQFKSITEALAEKNALNNLEVLIDSVKYIDYLLEMIDDMRPLLCKNYKDIVELREFKSKLSQAIKQSTHNDEPS